jgi:hypothetical protein
MVEEIDLTPYLEESVVRRYEITATLKNIHGEHASRVQTITGLVHSAEDKIIEDEKSKTIKKSTKRARIEEIHTFPTDDDGNLLVPLGGRRGYVYGALRVALLDLFKDRMRDTKWEGYGIGTYLEQAIFVTPEWVPVGKKFSHPKENPKKYGVMTAGIRKTMTRVYFDVVDKAEVEFAIEFTNEKIPEDIFLSLLAHTQRLGLGPKGRGSIKFLNVRRTK